MELEKVEVVKNMLYTEQFDTSKFRLNFMQS